MFALTPLVGEKCAQCLKITIFFWQMRKRALRERNPDFRQVVRDGLGTGPRIFSTAQDDFGVDVSVVLAMTLLLSEPRGP